jgi:hypothetical protein
LQPRRTAQEAELTLLDLWRLFGFEGAAGAWWPLTPKEERDFSQERKNARADWQNRLDAHLASLRERPDWPEFVERAYPKSPEPEKAAFKSDPARFIQALDRRRQDIHLRGALEFWDAFPEPRGGKLAVEIMTPHYGDYYTLCRHKLNFLNALTLTLSRRERGL